MEQQASLAAQRQLVQALVADLEAGGEQVCLHETHISWVLVHGAFAYKIKKAVRFDFLDFSTLAARRFYCEEELRLNRRFAPALYLELVPVTGTTRQPVLGGTGEVIEHAVKMRAFAQQALWTHRLDTGTLGAGEIDQLAGLLAAFHATAAHAPASARWGEAVLQHALADENADSLAGLLRAPHAIAMLAALRAQEAAARPQRAALFASRKRDGWVRECHGDLHAGNILTLDGRVQVFDCIEFNEELRWIDVINDIAFIWMALRLRHRADLAARLLNGYLEQTGDYGGLALLPYYGAQRALVRCKIALLRARQLPEQDPAQDAEPHACLALARDCMQPPTPFVAVMHGFSGSGKSVFAGQLVEATGALRLRSDVERKRMHGLAPHEPGGSVLYAEAATQAVYARLADLARQVISAGYPVVVDAAFLRRAQRQRFRALATELGVPYLILDMQAREQTLRARIIERARRGGDPSDADLAVLARQIACREPLCTEEGEAALAVDLDEGDPGRALSRVRARLAMVQPSPSTTGKNHD